MVTNLYHHFNLALSLQPCKVSIPKSPLTASLDVFEKQPSVHLPPNKTDSTVFGGIQFIVNMFKKGDKEDPSNYNSITLSQHTYMLSLECNSL